MSILDPETKRAEVRAAIIDLLERRYGGSLYVDRSYGNEVDKTVDEIMEIFD